MTDIVLVNIQFQPDRSPTLYASYLINRTHFETKYLPLFRSTETITLTHIDKSSQRCYDLELYMPSCTYQILTEAEQINSFKQLYGTKFHGNIDILEAILAYNQSINMDGNKRRKIQPPTPPSPPPPVSPFSSPDNSFIDLLSTILLTPPRRRPPTPRK